MSGEKNLVDFGLARGEGTRRAYRAAWSGFARWCTSLGRNPLAGDPDTIAMFLVRRADDGCAVSTLRVGLAAIRTAHLLAGVPLDLRHPALSMVLEGITRSKGIRPRRQATSAVPDLLRPIAKKRLGQDRLGGNIAPATLPMTGSGRLKPAAKAGRTAPAVSRRIGNGLRKLVAKAANTSG